MELHQLRYFCEVARSGSFTRAADDQRVAQPSLSQQILKLEQELGVPLFERLGRTVRLTPFGEALLTEATEILQRVSGAENAIAALQEGLRGRLRVGAIPTILPYFVAPNLGEFRGRHPEIEIVLSEDTTPRLIERLRAGDLDLAIAALPLRSPDLLTAELFREPAISRRRSARAHAAAQDGHCFRDDGSPPCDRFLSIFPLVASGFGVSLVPAMAAPHAHDCRILPLARPAFRRIGYAQTKRRFTSKPRSAFIAWLRELGNQSRTAVSKAL